MSARKTHYTHYKEIVSFLEPALCGQFNWKAASDRIEHVDCRDCLLCLRVRRTKKGKKK
jgi:hypothetical protein